MGTVYHHRREAGLDARLAGLERIAVVEMQNDRYGIAKFFGIFHCSFCQVLQEGLVGIFPGSLGNLKDYR